MMDSDSSFEQRQHHYYLWQLLVFLCQCLHCVGKNLSYTVALVFIVEITVFERHTISLALSFAETEHDARVQPFADDECDQLLHFLALSLLGLLGSAFDLFVLNLADGHVVFDYLNGFAEVVFTKNSFFVDY